MRLQTPAWSIQLKIRFHPPVDEILERRRGGDLFRYLLEKFAAFSGISGVQPKILVRDEKAFAEMKHTGHHLSQSYKGGTHIVKLWEANEYPQLAANEYFCLTVARKYGLDVPPYRLAEDGMVLVIDRFDLRMDGTYRGFEDFCVLNGRRTDEKYLETRMGATPARVRQILERTEAAIADTSKELRAHMKAHAEFVEIGNRMLEQWEQGVTLSLKAA